MSTPAIQPLRLPTEPGPPAKGHGASEPPESSIERVAVSQLVRHRNEKTSGPFRCRTELTATGRRRQSSDDSFEASVRYYGQVNIAGRYSRRPPRCASFEASVLIRTDC